MSASLVGAFSRCCLFASSFFAMGSAGAGHVSVLENPPGGGTIAEFGQLAAQPEFSIYYFAQTFTALEGSAKDLSFQLRTNLGPAPTNFHVLITEVATSGQGIHPSRVLFESETLSLPDRLFAPPTTFTVDLGLLRLVEDRSYAFVLDSFVVRQQGVFGTAQAIGGFGYDGGRFLSFGAPFDGDRAGHFASNWQEFPGGNVDIAFKMTFVVPEPPSIALVASLALLAGGSTALRRARPQNSRLARAA